MFQNFGTILETRVKKYSFRRELLEKRILQLWVEETERVLGSEFRKRVRALRFKNGVLEIVVNNSVLSQELRLREDQIKRNINKKNKGEVLQRIIYRMGQYLS